MYLSRLSLGGRRDAAARQVGEQSTYGVHQAVWERFADSADRDRDFIYRVDSASPLVLYALSARAPRDPTGSWQIETKPFAPQLCAGDALSFRLRFNAVVTRRNAAGRHARFDIVRAALRQQDNDARQPTPQLIQEKGTEWVAQRGEENSRTLYDLRSCNILSYRRERIRRTRTSQKMTDLAVMDAEGVLVVRDADAFLDRLLRGFGRSRAFGLGLMLIRRA